jgi:hypothetical protein
MNGPEKSFRSGTVVASVWNNEIEKEGEVKSFKSVSFEKRYKDKNEEWQTAASLNVSDIPKAILVLEEVYRNLNLRTSD